LGDSECVVCEGTKLTVDRLTRCRNHSSFFNFIPKVQCWWENRKDSTRDCYEIGKSRFIVLTAEEERARKNEKEKEERKSMLIAAAGTGIECSLSTVSRVGNRANLGQKCKTCWIQCPAGCSLWRSEHLAKKRLCPYDFVWSKENTWFPETPCTTEGCVRGYIKTRRRRLISRLRDHEARGY